MAPRAVSRKADEFAIGTPGDRKLDLTNLLAPLWRAAEDAIKAADSIVFIGYRFPPSDAYARSKILGAIANNDRDNVVVHFVLGPSSPDAERLRQLVLHTMRSAKRGHRERVGAARKHTFQIVEHALWAEDFMSVVPTDYIRSHIPFGPLAY